MAMTTNRNGSNMSGISAAHYRLTLSQASSMHCGFNQIEYLDRTGVRAAKARRRQVGRPKRIFRRDEAVRLRAEGKSWRTIADVLGVPVATLIDACKPRR